MKVSNLKFENLMNYSRAFHRELQWDGWVGLLCILVGFLGLRLSGSSQLWNRWLTLDPTVPVASLGQPEGGVRIRQSGTTVWWDLNQPALEMGEGDAVYTGKNGSALLDFHEGGTAQLSPNSLVIIESPLRVEDGVLGKIGRWISPKSRKNPVRIQVKTGKVQLNLPEGSPGAIVKAGKKTAEFVTQGRRSAVTIEAVGNEFETTELLIENDNHLNPNLQVKDPITGKATERRSLSDGNLAWIEPEAAPAPVFTENLVPPSAKLAPVVEAPAPPPPVKTMAKVEAPPAPPSAPVTKKILAAIQASTAVASTRLEGDFELDRLPVDLNWTDQPGINKYDVELFEGKNQKVKEMTVTQPPARVVLNSLAGKRYYYRVTGFLEDGTTVKSPQIPLLIRVLPPLLASPEDHTAFEGADSILLTWEKTKLTKNYGIQVAKDKEFRQLVLDEKTTTNLKSFSGSDPGDYYWRVRSFTEDAESEWSQSRIFTIQ